MAPPRPDGGPVKPSSYLVECRRLRTTRSRLSRLPVIPAVHQVFHAVPAKKLDRLQGTRLLYGRDFHPAPLSSDRPAPDAPTALPVGALLHHGHLQHRLGHTLCVLRAPVASAGLSR